MYQKTNPMKTIIFTLTLICFFASCKQEDPSPIQPFVGSWHLISEDQQIQISFDVVYEGATAAVPDGIYNYYNRRVIHPAIPEDQQHKNTMLTYDRFDNGMGYGRIEIKSRGTVVYDVVMIYNRFIYNSDTQDYDMAVYDVQINVAGQDQIILQDQVFVKGSM